MEANKDEILIVIMPANIDGEQRVKQPGDEMLVDMDETKGEGETCGSEVVEQKTQKLCSDVLVQGVGEQLAQTGDSATKPSASQVLEDDAAWLPYLNARSALHLLCSLVFTRFDSQIRDCSKRMIFFLAKKHDKTFSILGPHAANTIPNLCSALIRSSTCSR